MKHYFLFLALFVSAIALLFPQGFVYGKAYIPFLLGVIMFGMGLTLTPRDFKYVWQNKRSVLVGVAAQYSIMPVLAFVLGNILGLEQSLLIGMILVGACPGGTASNVMVYLANGNVALSVTMTLISTLMAPFLTPLIVSLFVNQIVDVQFLKMMYSVLQIIILPISLGLIVRFALKDHLAPFLKIFPYISMMTIVFVIAVVVALNRTTLLTFPIMILAGVVLHNLMGLALGYHIAKWSRCPEPDRRAIAIEVGMQNSGLAVTLAAQFFSASSALPGAVFSLWHNLSGSALAQFYARKSSGFKG